MKDSKELDINNVSITAAFMAMGAVHNTSFNIALAIFENGCVEFISQLVQYAELSESHLATLGDEIDYPGVYDYEVSDPFGSWFVNFVCDNNCVPNIADASMKLLDMIDTFFKQGEPV